MLIKGSLIAFARAIKGNGKLKNHYVQVFGVGFLGFGICIGWPRKNKKSKEDQDLETYFTIRKWTEEERLRSGPRRN